MLPQFINREQEIKFLENVYNTKGFSLIVLYGRRRVGKTELIKKFLENRKAVYILSTDESFEENAKLFKSKFAEITGKEYFLKLETSSLYELFKFFYDEVKKEKIILAIDEFPYLLSTKKGILSLFQKIIDEILSKTNIKLILCGSSMSVMESDVLGKGTPLYGRNTNIWKLLPLKFNEIVKHFNNPFEVYFVFGNIPYYLKFYDDNKRLIENIRINLLTKGMNLYDEPLVLLRQEFRESRVYRLILKYISLGYKTIGKLCSATGMDKSNLMKYLSSLEEVGIIRHIVPFGMKRKGIYEIIDPLFRFWFRFIYTYRDLLEIRDIKSVESKISKELNSFFGTSFEYLIESLMKEKTFKEFIDFDIYKWWHKDKEIDVLALNEKTKEILACECKWQSRVNVEKIVKELNEKLGCVDWYKDKRKESFAVFAKSFSKRIKRYEGKRVYCFDLKGLEKILRKR
ncbi:MAG: ATP-binding protein [Candidatus Aenigmatarchaeota archaeon]|nr:MAG: ATP-binding protein [Candidatus Aenigmarchaeota archaeon]